MTPTRPLKVALLCHPTYGGSGVVASELALSLAERGHVVHLFAHRVPPRLAASPGPVEVHASQGLPYPLFSSTPHDLAITSAVLATHRTVGFDILHAHYALPHAMSAIVARSAAAFERLEPVPRVVTTLHGTDVTIVGKDPSYAPLTQYLIAGSDAATAVSRALAEETRQHFCLASAPTCGLQVIPNFVDTDFFRPTPGPVAAPRYAVHVSNFRPVKRVPWLIEAFAEASRGTEYRLVLVGDGPDRAACEALAGTLGIAKRVRFLGMRDALPELLAPAAVFLLASREESFGLSALEAMACGVPVVATSVGGVAEVVDDGVTGLLVAMRDKAGFASATRRLLEDTEEATAMGEAARARVVAEFSRERIVARYEELYCQVLAGPTGAATRALGTPCGA